MSKLSEEDRKKAEKDLIERRMKQEEEARKREALDHERARKAREAAKKRKKEAEAKAKLDRMPKEQREAHALKDEGNKLCQSLTVLLLLPRPSLTS